MIVANDTKKNYCSTILLFVPCISSRSTGLKFLIWTDNKIRPVNRASPKTGKQSRSSIFGIFIRFLNAGTESGGNWAPVHNGSLRMLHARLSICLGFFPLSLGDLLKFNRLVYSLVKNLRNSAVHVQLYWFIAWLQSHPVYISPD